MVDLFKQIQRRSKGEKTSFSTDYKFSISKGRKKDNFWLFSVRASTIKEKKENRITNDSSVGEGALISEIERKVK